MSLNQSEEVLSEDGCASIAKMAGGVDAVVYYLCENKGKQMSPVELVLVGLRKMNEGLEHVPDEGDSFSEAKRKLAAYFRKVADKLEE